MIASIATMTVRQAEKVLLAHKGHHPECDYRARGMWNRSGICERCTAFMAIRGETA
jgi:hypothetical protein